VRVLDRAGVGEVAEVREEHGPGLEPRGLPQERRDDRVGVGSGHAPLSPAITKENR
jgi:hypothetical protein